MLGIYQTVIFALFMVIIGAFIGTEDLGQFIIKALSDKQGIGNGLLLGLCVASIGLAVDHQIQTWSNERKRVLGLPYNYSSKTRSLKMPSRNWPLGR